jgi:hypothetical protein
MMQNEMFTFELDSENALVGCTLERVGPQRSNLNLVHGRCHSQPPAGPDE